MTVDNSPGTAPAPYTGKRLTIGCPHCGSVLKVRSSRLITATVRQVVLACQNDEACGATFGADVTVTHVISPGAAPNPRVHLRTAPPRRRPANDGMPPSRDAPRGPEVPPANDDDATVATTG